MNRNDRLPTVAPAHKWLLSLAFSAMGFASIASAQTPSTSAPAEKTAAAKLAAPKGKAKPSVVRPAAEPQTTATTANGGTLPEVVVSAPKLGQDLQSLPLSSTVATGQFVNETASRTIKDAAIYSPNTFFTEFAARAVSNPRIRGIGGSGTNPGITSYYDGVPQLNGYSSSLELLDVAQVDIVRGPLGSLYGRNTAGGMVNITSQRPSLHTFGGEFESTFGSYNTVDVRGKVTAPLIQDQLGFSFAGGYNSRDGYTTNDFTGNDLDYRSSLFGKAQFLWTPDERLEVRFILAGESNRDGDYALGDLASLRRNPRHVSRNFEGYVERDVIMPTLQITYHADAFDFTSTTGLVYWKTEDKTDLDYTPFLSNIRLHQDEFVQWTQEFRFSNPLDRPITLSEEATLAWQAGLFLFHSELKDRVVNSTTPPLSPVALDSIQTATLTDVGIGAYAQSTLTLWKKLDITAGLRWDYEYKEADLGATTAPAFPGGTSAFVADREFSRVTPQASIAYHVTPDLMPYFAFAGGYKAGGFNAAGPVTYEEEKTWNYELGIKGRALDGKLRFGLAAYYTDWSNLQLTQLLSATQTFTANAGDATSKGVELDLNYQVSDMISVFGSAGWQDTQFLSDATESGVPVAGRTLPYAPDYTVTLGTRVEVPITPDLNLYGRVDCQFIGRFEYDSRNSNGQDAYTLLNFRLGVNSKRSGWFAEAFVNNALDTEYVPIALPYFTSPYVGESGAPCTFGIRAGVKF